MTKPVTMVWTVVLAGVLATPAGAAEITVKGEVVEMACATSKGEGGRGNAHAACALSCARKGEPVGILTSDAVYEVVGDFAANRNAKLLDFLAKSVTVTGEVIERDGKRLLNLKTIRAN